MRYKPEHKEETRRRIVETASREFRENGFDGVGIAVLMQKLKLTHGGFYAHFANKNDLVQEALSTSFDQVDERLEESVERFGLAGAIDLYLSPEHVDNPGFGCPVPSLISEIGRQPGSVTSLFTDRLNRRIDRLAVDLPGATAGERRDLATYIFSSMVGAVSLARAVSDPGEKLHILGSTKTRLLDLIKK